MYVLFLRRKKVLHYVLPFISSKFIFITCLSARMMTIKIIRLKSSWKLRWSVV